jgi:methylenetetrahydrofolate reductase (NADPH)
LDLRDAFHFRRTTISFEFFPPKTPAGAEDLLEHVVEFERLRPTFVSVTYGAGGSTRQLTNDLVVKIKGSTTLDPMPHLTCVGHTHDEIDEILDRYAQAGINKILALRGDPPKAATGAPPANPADFYKEFKFASDLVGHIKHFNERGRHKDRRGFAIGVAGFPEGHPDTPNRLAEMDRLKAKIEAGADFIITQLFFDNRDFYDFRDRCELAGIRVPILAGIMPITSIAGMKRMAELALGARYPAPLTRAINRAVGGGSGSDESVRRVGVHWATEQARDLLDHKVAGIHFYTLNKSNATREIYQTLGVQDSEALRY